MRSRSFHQTMLQLAVIAALLMALMPTMIRIGGHIASGHSDRAALCDMPSMHVHHRFAIDAGQTLPAHDDGDCAYCPLLASLTLLAFVLLVLPMLRLPAWISLRQPVAPCRTGRHPCGLGSRGPPLAV